MVMFGKRQVAPEAECVVVFQPEALEESFHVFADELDSPARSDAFMPGCGSDGGAALAGMSRVSTWVGEASMSRMSSWSSMANHSSSMSRIGSWADMTELEESGFDEADLFTQTICIAPDVVTDSTISNIDGERQGGHGEPFLPETQADNNVLLCVVACQEELEGPKVLQPHVKFMEQQLTEAVAEERRHCETQTTLVLGSLPERLTLAALLDLIIAKGFANVCSFVYLPMDMLVKMHLGYALVNISDPGDVDSFWAAFDGFADWTSPSAAVCRVGWDSERRGLADLVDRFRNSQLMHRTVPDEYRPVLLERGERVPFPAPTKQIRAPRPHKSIKKPGSSGNAL